MSARRAYEDKVADALREYQLHQNAEIYDNQITEAERLINNDEAQWKNSKSQSSGSRDRKHIATEFKGIYHGVQVHEARKFVLNTRQDTRTAEDMQGTNELRTGKTQGLEFETVSAQSETEDEEMQDASTYDASLESDTDLTTTSTISAENTVATRHIHIPNSVRQFPQKCSIIMSTVRRRRRVKCLPLSTSAKLQKQEVDDEDPNWRIQPLRRKLATKTARQQAQSTQSEEIAMGNEVNELKTQSGSTESAYSDDLAESNAAYERLNFEMMMRLKRRRMRRAPDLRKVLLIKQAEKTRKTRTETNTN
jgi:hypothetical protein